MIIGGKVTAIIADDEPLLRIHLHEKLLALWPQLHIVGEASNGIDAAEMIARLAPDIAFLDIKMPGLSGIEVAQGLESETRVVFVTAFDQYAVDAFESEAIDYVLKPVTDARLVQTIVRVQKSLAEKTPAPEIAALLNALMKSSSGNASSANKLRWIRANRGDTTYQIAVDEVLFFQSADKYTVVMTASGEHLISTTLNEIISGLNSELFWQIHRSTIVNIRNVTSTRRDGEGRMNLYIKGYDKPLAVSRAYQSLFRQM